MSWCHSAPRAGRQAGIPSVWVKEPSHGGAVPLQTFCLHTIMVLFQHELSGVLQECTRCTVWFNSKPINWHNYSHMLERLRKGTQIPNGILQTCLSLVHTSLCCDSWLQPGSPGHSINTSGPCFVCCGLIVILSSPGQGEVPPVPPLTTSLRNSSAAEA